MADKRPASDEASAGSAKKAKLDLGSKEFFLSVYDELKAFILNDVIPQYGLPAEAIDWTREMLDYNVPGVCRVCFVA